VLPIEHFEAAFYTVSGEFGETPDAEGIAVFADAMTTCCN
jgi:hypothetical protein